MPKRPKPKAKGNVEVREKKVSIKHRQQMENEIANKQRKTTPWQKAKAKRNAKRHRVSENAIQEYAKQNPNQDLQRNLKPKVETGVR
jgi:hypothetical protein